VLASPSSNISSRGDFHITSAGNIASDPYARKKSDWPVALLGCVRSPQTTDEISLIHLPSLFALLVIKSFLQSIKNQAIGMLNLAVGPQMSHRYIFDFNGAAFTEILELMRVEIGSQICDNSIGEAKSQRTVTTRSAVTTAIGLYSIHFVNLLMATNTCVKPPSAIVKGRIMSKPQHANGHEGGIVISL
jgi:hypothetical protein